MRRIQIATTAVIALGFALACGSSDKEVDSGTDSGTDTTDPSNPWSAETSPCSGSKMEALYCSDALTCHVGCGSNADGAGLFVTGDGGQSWSMAEDSAGGAFFDSFRVLDITPDGSGGLYVAGTGTTDHRVVGYDPATGDLSEVYTNDPNVDYSMTVGTYARTSDGTEVAESLTGAGVVVRKDDSDFRDTYADYDGWASAYGWWHTAGFSNHNQILDLAVVDDQILGVGAQINYTPVVYLPPRSWDFATDNDGDEDGYLESMWEVVELVDSFSTYDGECWHVDGNSDGIALACVNEDADVGRVYTIGADWQTAAYDTENWTETRVEEIVAFARVDGHSTYNEGVCRGPDNDITVVGRDSQTDNGYAIRSTDGGASWAELTADIADAYGDDFGPATRCMYTDTHLLIGGSGLYAHVALADL